MKTCNVLAATCSISGGSLFLLREQVFMWLLTEINKNRWHVMILRSTPTTSSSSNMHMK
jgi:hypothetical protein